MKKSDQQALLKALADQGHIVSDMGKVHPDEMVVLDLDCYEQEDGTVVAYFSSIPGATVSGVDLVHAIALLEAIAHLVAEYIRDDPDATGLRGEDEPDEDGAHSGVVAVSALHQRGVRMGLVQGVYCMGLVGVDTALIECKTKDALGKVFGQIVRMGVSIYHHEREESENPQQAKAPGADIVIGRPGASKPKPFKTND